MRGKVIEQVGILEEKLRKAHPLIERYSYRVVILRKRMAILKVGEWEESEGKASRHRNIDYEIVGNGWKNFLMTGELFPDQKNAHVAETNIHFWEGLILLARHTESDTHFEPHEITQKMICDIISPDRDRAKYIGCGSIS